MDNQAGNIQNMRPGPVLLSVLAVAILSGCGVVRNIAASAPTPQSLSFRTVAPTPGSGSDVLDGIRASGLVARSQSELVRELVNRRYETEQVSDNQAYEAFLSKSIPTLDFSTEQGILATFGAQGNTCYRGEIVSVEERQDRIVVHTVLWAPRYGQSCGAAIVYPYHYVAIPKSAKPVEFREPVRKEVPGAWWQIF